MVLAAPPAWEALPLLLGAILTAVGVAVQTSVERRARQTRERGRARTEKRLLELGDDRSVLEERVQMLCMERAALRQESESLEQLLAGTLLESDYRELKGRADSIRLGIQRLEHEVDRARAEIASMEGPTSPSEWDHLMRERAERRQLEAKLADYERVVPFEVESQRAKRSSTVAFFSGVLVVLIVLGVALRDWWEHEGGEALTTGTGLARLGAVLAAFYVAGQLFKRSTALQLRSQEFERAAIAMKVTPDLAKQIVDRDARDQFVIQIYTSHLAPSTPTKDSGGGETGGLDLATIVDGYSKLRASG